jgi:hypothetical protein
MSAKPTPTPWKVSDQFDYMVFDENDHPIADAIGIMGNEVDAANATRIVRCVNAMPAMVEALKLAKEAIDELTAAQVHRRDTDDRLIHNAEVAIFDALALAKGE